MIKPPSLQSESSLIYSGDPALNLPEDPDERARVLQVARETNKWADLLIAGETPTTFNVRPLTGSQFDWWCGEVRRRSLSDAEAAALALRFALHSVTGFGSFGTLKRERIDGHSFATVEIIDALYASTDGHGRSIVLELGGVIVERASSSPSPK